MLSSSVVLLVWLRLSEAITSQRAKCAVECYVRCVNSGTVSDLHNTFPGTGKYDMWCRRMLSSAVVLLVWLRLSEAITSQRAKCAVECYVRCVNSGTVSDLHNTFPGTGKYDMCMTLERNLF
ncbi:unnamed protein product [Toxocara canis]|uniref:Secreted protein n=1 Tax=Toxocara canis TaxID=6265 RepID=A0A183UPD4_TOXCA|nr:unnamed protein product [Toxocara canis]